MILRLLVILSLCFLTAISGFCAGVDQDNKTNAIRQSPELETNPVASDLSNISVDANLNFSQVHWTSHNGTALSPEIGISYIIDQVFAPRLNVKYFSVSDGNSTLDVFGIGGGLRIWIPVEGSLVPFIGGALDYYDLSLSGAGNVKGACSLIAEAGVGYFFTDNFSVTINISGDTSLVNGTASINGHDEDIAMNTISFGIGLNARF